MKRSSPSSSSSSSACCSNNDPLWPAVSIPVPVPEDVDRRLGLPRMAAVSAAGAGSGSVPKPKPSQSQSSSSSSSCFGDYLFRPLVLGISNNDTQQQQQHQQRSYIIEDTGRVGRSVRKGDKTIITETEKEDVVDDSTLLLAEAMTHLSLKEREQAYEDLHGVSETINETPELIAQSIHTMKQHLLLETIPNKLAYELAITIDNGKYVHDPQLLLMFLRADRLDSKKASKRFITWLDWKLQLFGPTKLCHKNIYFNDLDEDTRSMVESGFYQILPIRDSCGRVVVVVAANHKHRLFRSTKSILQMFFYMNLCIMQEDVTNQKNGMVIIIYNLENNKNKNKHKQDNSIDETNEMKYSTHQSARMLSSMPIRTEAIHILKSDTMLKQYTITLIVHTFNQFLRARARVHFGSHLECVYTLLSFGIPSTLLPLTTEGELKTNHHKKWIQRRLIRDYDIVCNLPMNPNYIFTGIELPNRNDVLFGQGIPRQTHPGNQQLNELIQFYLDEYNATSHCKDTQRLVILKVIHDIKNSNSGSGGRFLKLRNKEERKNIGWWEEETIESVLLEKVRNGFRNARRSCGELQRHTNGLVSQ